MLKFRGNASAQAINMVAKPLLRHVDPDKRRFEAWAPDLNQDHPLGFVMQETFVEGKVILSKFWHRFP